MPFLCANASHESPEMAAAYLLQLAAMPVCVGPGAVTLDVVVGELDLVVVGAALPPEMPTQYHS
jgi:hypothetical protein